MFVSLAGKTNLLSIFCLHVLYSFFCLSIYKKNHFSVSLFVCPSVYEFPLKQKNCSIKKEFFSSISLVYSFQDLQQQTNRRVRAAIFPGHSSQSDDRRPIMTDPLTQLNRFHSSLHAELFVR